MSLVGVTMAQPCYLMARQSADSDVVYFGCETRDRCLSRVRGRYRALHLGSMLKLAKLDCCGLRPRFLHAILHTER